MVDLSEKEEMEQNLFMNNEKAMGEYDPFMLACYKSKRRGEIRLIR